MIVRPGGTGAMGEKEERHSKDNDPNVLEKWL